MDEAVRVLIVDDSAFMRRAVERMLEGTPEIEVVGSAADGEEAVAKTGELHPDVVVLDVNMPELGGLEALERIMREAPTGVLMLSTLTREGAQTTLRALELGAVDFLDKHVAGTTMDIYTIAPLLREKVLAVAGASLPGRERPPSAAEKPEREAAPRRSPVTSPYEVVVIGASTGGPRALAELLECLPADFPTGVVVVQHMPAGFTETLANRLDRRSDLEVVEAHDMAEVQPGRVLIAPGGKQIRLDRAGGKLVARIGAGPVERLHCPSVDVLFMSAAELVGPRAVGLVMTGMGDDGSRGLMAMKEAGARTLAESEESAVIFGMPRAAAPAADRLVALRDIPAALVEITMGSGHAEGP